MAFQSQGKFLFLISLLFILSYSSYTVPVSVVSDSVPILHDNETETGNESDRQDFLLHKLEGLVKNLTEVVAKLETKLSDSSALSGFDDNRRPEGAGLPLKEKDEINQRKYKQRTPEKESAQEQGEDEEGEGSEGRTRDGQKGGAFSVTKFSPFWSERFKFVSAVKLDSDATSINVLPFRDYEGLSKYFAVGDGRGRVYVFLRNGDVLVEFYTNCDSPVTSMVSYLSVYKNETLVVTGHQNGEILLHRVYEGSPGDDWNLVVMETVRKFSGTENREERFPVTLLEVHHVGRVRYILVTDLIGKITVYKENGTIYGSAMPSSRPLVFLKQRLLFLTETGAGSLDLRSMKIRESECEGLNHSLARTYVFDATERSKAYGFTSEGEIVHVLLLGDIMNFKCRVRSKRKFQMEEPLVFQAIKGYLLIISQEKVFVYNVSTQHYVRTGGPRFLFSANLDEIRSAFLNFQESNKIGERNKVIPLIASDREKLVVLGLGAGYVATYRSKLPVFKGEFNTMLWSSPVFFFILFLFGAWHFFAKKKEVLTSWGPDDPLSSPGAQVGQAGERLGQASKDRTFVESSRRNDGILDLRRRYVSPSRYPAGGGTASSYRPGSTDPSSRTPVDQNYRGAASELKFRGSALEPSGFSTRRESLFVNSQNMDDES